eukprot:GHVT01016823.1.p1 GENE.GHVT01016823.1~~GHVT01016823.1.p1  ORF type:complete len:398 (-),score=51.17 GHVT01016823.1:739-1932(-)
MALNETPPLPTPCATEALDVFSPPDLASVPELLGLHFHRIKNLRKKLGKVLSHVHDSHLSDNLFLLRYVLSYKGNEEQAASAIIRATEFRRHHANFVKGCQSSPFPLADSFFPLSLRPFLPTIRSLLAACPHKQTRQGHPVILVRLGASNLATLMDVVPIDVMVDYIVFSNEVEFWLCDHLTRTHLKLFKTYRLVDLDQLSYYLVDRRFFSVFKNASMASEFLHPQLVAKTILVNAPGFVRWVVETLKMIGVSKRALAKLWLHERNLQKPLAEHQDLLEIFAYTVRKRSPRRSPRNQKAHPTILAGGAARRIAGSGLAGGKAAGKDWRGAPEQTEREGKEQSQKNRSRSSNQRCSSSSGSIIIKMSSSRSINSSSGSSGGLFQFFPCLLAPLAVVHS